MVTPGSQADVSTPSMDRNAMDRDLDLISDIRAGAEAIRARSARYLPKYSAEDFAEYRRRVETSPWRAEFVDCLRSLTSKPFAKDVTVADDTPDPLKDFAQDVDGRGNNLTRFAREAFVEAVASGVHAILVDYPAIVPDGGRPLTLAEERALGVRPYWLQVPVKNIIALRTATLAGREIVTHLRILESSIEPDGAFGEQAVQRIRVINPGEWQVWEKQQPQPGQPQGSAWVQVGKGTVSITDEVPLAIVFTGERIGTLQTRPPLKDLAEVQIELYRAMSRQDEILTYAGSPMLAAPDIAKPKDGEVTVTVGPKTVLWGSGGGGDGGRSSKWEYVQPDAANMTEIRNHVASIIQDLKRLGMQPTTPQSGGITATATSVDAAKAHSALEAWATAFKDMLEHAFGFTAEWLQIDHETVVQISTDFAAADQSVPEAAVLLVAQKQMVLSAQTTREELQRRGLLGPQWDAAAEDERLASEHQGIEPEQDIDPVTGAPVNDNSGSGDVALPGADAVTNDRLRRLFSPEILGVAGM